MPSRGVRLVVESAHTTAVCDDDNGGIDRIVLSQALLRFPSDQWTGMTGMGRLDWA